MPFATQSYSEPSNLSHGFHPAFLVAITTEPVPAGWEMGKKDTHMYRWHLAVYQTPQDVPTANPEEQNLITSRAFTPKGNFQASNAYLFTCALIGREPSRGETINLEAMLPLPCIVEVTREPGNQYARCKKLVAWPPNDSQWPLPATMPQAVLALHQQFAGAMAQPQAAQPTPQQAPAPVAPAAPLQPPGMQTYATAPAPAPQPNRPAFMGAAPNSQAGDTDDIPF